MCPNQKKQSSGWVCFSRLSALYFLFYHFSFVYVKGLQQPWDGERWTQGFLFGRVSRASLDGIWTYFKNNTFYQFFENSDQCIFSYSEPLLLLSGLPLSAPTPCPQLPRIWPLKKTESSSSNSSFSARVGLLAPSSVCTGLLSGFGLCWSCMCCHSHCGFICVIVLLCPFFPPTLPFHLKLS